MQAVKLETNLKKPKESKSNTLSADQMQNIVAQARNSGISSANLQTIKKDFVAK